VTQRDDLPFAVWSGEFRVGGVTLKCHVLSDGTRVIERESVAEFFNMLAGEEPIDPREMEAFARWQRGQGR